jgi:hypothetical protein
MRLMLIVFLLLSGAAQARDCDPPRVTFDEVLGLRDFSRCLLAEIADLKREQARLLGEIGKLQKRVASVPGEFVNENGRVTLLGGDDLVRASFAVTSRARDGAIALGIDQAVLEELCAKSCTLSLTLTAVGLRQADPAPVFAVGPCVFRYNGASGVWARSDACGKATMGVDGNGRPRGRSGGEVIVAAAEACLLADSEPSRDLEAERQSLGRDLERGLFLIADAAYWDGDEARFRCDLKVSR